MKTCQKPKAFKNNYNHFFYVKTIKRSNLAQLPVDATFKRIFGTSHILQFERVLQSDFPHVIFKNFFVFI